MAALTAVVILNWNGLHLMQRFLPGVVANTPSADIVVIDNASIDGSQAWLASHWPQVQVIELDQNYGFAGGYNRGLEMLPHRYVVLLNSDVEVTPNWLPPLEQFMDQHPQAAGCQPKILDLNNRSHFEYAGAAGGYLDRFGFAFCRGRIFDVLEADKGQYDQPARVLWASGACLMMRRDLYVRIGGLANEFFAHMEEIDLCWRLGRAGHQLWCVPQSAVYHLGGGSLDKTNARKTYLNFRNNLLMMVRNMSGFGAFWIIFHRMNLDGVAGVRFFFQGKFSFVWAIILAHKDFYKMLPWALRSKQKFAGVEDQARACILPGMIIYKHYVFKKRRFSELGWGVK